MRFDLHNISPDDPTVLRQIIKDSLSKHFDSK